MKGLKYRIPNFGPKMPRMLMMQMQDSESCEKVESQETIFFYWEKQRRSQRNNRSDPTWENNEKGEEKDPTPLGKQCSFTGERLSTTMQMIT
ncbi:hypothetical protein QL285_028658 [Trifolium repens]|nr:hypothetical protein QL285_028658 [Trifolium repens]